MGYADYYFESAGSLEFVSLLMSALSSFGSLISLALYILMSLGLYTIAQRRELKNAWLAFLPIGNLWILGSIADQYQYVLNGQVRNRRKLLLALQIISFILGIAIAVAIIAAVFQVILVVEGGSISEQMLFMEILKRVAPSFLLIALAGLVSLLTFIFSWICYYALFSSCDPEHNVLYLILGILFSFMMPIFVFMCRNKDLGMPPRPTPIPGSYSE